MPSDVGPYDGRRARRKRCDACVKRRIKCRDGIPCENCKRTGRSCTTSINQVSSLPVFVGWRNDTEITSKELPSLLEDRAAISVPQSLGLKDYDRTFPYFFTSFLSMNALISDKSTDGGLLALAKSSPALRDAIHAVAALHRKQQDQFAVTEANGRCETFKALEAYNRSVHCMQIHITQNSFLRDPSVLWTTFLLGLFELMRDSTGTNWLSHFLHGTCAILRLQHPESLACPGSYNLQKRTFFLTTRIFEIARSLIYTSPTFLSEPEWIASLARLWKNEGASSWHPKEALFDILPSFADLNIRTLDFCKNIAHTTTEIQHRFVQSLAKEGMSLRKALERWWKETAKWESRNSNCRSTVHSRPTTELLIGQIYYHAISIYLSGTFDYHIHWSWPDAPCAPILSRSQIEWHMWEILHMSQELLAQGVSGVLLFVPLRIAGARAVDIHSKTIILDHLHTIARRGFIVAEAFTIDLSDLWANQSIPLYVH